MRLPHFATVLGLLACACKDPAAVPAEPDASADAGGLPVESSERQSIAVRNVGAPPKDIEPTLWREVGWFPEPIASMSEFTRPDSAAVVQWLASVAPRELVCNRALYAVDHYFLVQADSHALEPTHVLYGTSQREHVEGCAAMLQFGAAVLVRAEGPLTLVRVGSRDTWLGWMTLDEQTVIVADRDRARVERFLSDSKGLDSGGAFVAALRDTDRSADTWSAALGDRTSDLVESPSIAHGWSLKGLAADTKAPVPLRVRAWATFGDEAQADRAKAALDHFAARYEAQGGTKLSLSTSRVSDTAEVRVGLEVSSMAQLAEIYSAARLR